MIGGESLCVRHRGAHGGLWRCRRPAWRPKPDGGNASVTAHRRL